MEMGPVGRELNFALQGFPAFNNNDGEQHEDDERFRTGRIRQMGKGFGRKVVSNTHEQGTW